MDIEECYMQHGYLAMLLVYIAITSIPCMCEERDNKPIVCVAFLLCSDQWLRSSFIFMLDKADCIAN